MLVTTTNTVEGHRILKYKGLTAAKAIPGANHDVVAFSIQTYTPPVGATGSRMPDSVVG